MAITMGDASGVGPEIVLRCAAAGRLDGAAGPVVVYGDAAILRHGATLLGLDLDIVAMDGPDLARPGALHVVDLGLLAATDHRPGRLDATSGAAARQYVQRATADALAGLVAGVVTLPMNYAEPSRQLGRGLR